MARPIKETPEQRARRLADYEMCMKMLKAGEHVKLNSEDDEEP